MYYEIKVIKQDVQEQTINIFDMNLKLKLVFNEVNNSFHYDLFDINKNEYIVKSRGLSLGSPSLMEKRLPFVLTLMDESGQDLKTTSLADFVSRIKLVAMSIDNFRKYLLSK